MAPREARQLGGCRKVYRGGGIVGGRQVQLGGHALQHPRPAGGAVAPQHLGVGPPTGGERGRTGGAVGVVHGSGNFRGHQLPALREAFIGHYRVVAESVLGCALPVGLPRIPASETVNAKKGGGAPLAPRRPLYSAGGSVYSDSRRTTSRAPFR